VGRREGSVVGRSGRGRDIGKKIRDLRKGRGWTLAKLAEASGLSKGYLSQLENGKVNEPSPLVVEDIARVFGMSGDELLRMAHGELHPGPVVGGSPFAEQRTYLVPSLDLLRFTAGLNPPSDPERQRELLTSWIARKLSGDRLVEDVRELGEKLDRLQALVKQLMLAMVTTKRHSRSTMQLDPSSGAHVTPESGRIPTSLWRLECKVGAREIRWYKAGLPLETLAVEDVTPLARHISEQFPRACYARALLKNGQRRCRYIISRRAVEAYASIDPDSGYDLFFRDESVVGLLRFAGSKHSTWHKDLVQRLIEGHDRVTRALDPKKRLENLQEMLEYENFALAVTAESCPVSWEAARGSPAVMLTSRGPASEAPWWCIHGSAAVVLGTLNPEACLIVKSDQSPWAEAFVTAAASAYDDIWNNLPQHTKDKPAIREWLAELVRKTPSLVS